MTRFARIGFVFAAALAFSAGAAHAQLAANPVSTTASSNQTVRMDVNLVNPGAVPIDAFGFQLTYPANLLNFQSVSVAGTLTQSWIVVSGNENSPGLVQIGGFNFTPLTTGGLLLRVTFQVETNKIGSGTVALSSFVDDLAGASTANATFTAAVTPGAAGLLGEYYDNVNFTGALLQRLDPNVNFEWDTASPDPSMDADFFSVRWTGWVKPDYSQTYTFYTITDDGVRLWVNNQLIINEWHDQYPTERSGTIALTGGTLATIKMEFYEGDGGAVAQLLWSSASQTKQGIPQDHLLAAPCLQGTGDVDGSGILDVSDVACAFDTYLFDQTIPPGCNSTNTTCELLTADVNCSGAVTPADARAIEARRAASLAPATCFASPEPAPPAPPYTIGIDQQVVDDGGTLRLAVLLVIENAANLDAFGARLAFPSALVSFNRVERGYFTSAWHTMGGRVRAPGQIVFGGFDPFSALPAGTADVCRIYFDFLGTPQPVAGLTLSNFVDDFRGAIIGTVTDVGTPASSTHRLHQNHPNPFNPTTQIRYDVAGRGSVRVRIAIYDVRGSRVRVLVDEARAPGAYVATWDGRADDGAQAASGVYFYSMQAGSYAASRRMVLLK